MITCTALSQGRPRRTQAVCLSPCVKLGPNSRGQDELPWASVLSRLLRKDGGCKLWRQRQQPRAFWSYDLPVHAYSLGDETPLEETGSGCGRSPRGPPKAEAQSWGAVPRGCAGPALRVQICTQDSSSQVPAWRLTLSWTPRRARGACLLKAITALADKRPRHTGVQKRSQHFAEVWPRRVLEHHTAGCSPHPHPELAQLPFSPQLTGAATLRRNSTSPHSPDDVFWGRQERNSVW